VSLIGNTYTPFDAKGIREDLSDAIYNISPKDTPFMSNIKKGQAAQTFFEWQIDSLAAAVTTNAQLDGDDVSSYDAANPTTRVGNYTQISRKTVIVSGTLEAVDKAGRKSELAYQLAKKSAELKRDIEATMLSNQGASAGAIGAARKTGSFIAWLKTNCASTANTFDASSPNTDTNAPVYTNIPTAGRTDGTQGAFTETMVSKAMVGAYTQGGKPEMLMVGPANKRVFSTFSGVATKTFYQSAVEETAVIGSADVYVSDFGILAVVPNRFQRNRDAFLIDPEFAAMIFLRPFMTEPLAKTGDAEKRMVIVEWGLKVHNEAAHAAIFDLS
jgi:hypothetical protein